MPSPLIVARIKGGLGNQLFCYAAARRLSLINDMELAIDNVTGFVRDRKYRRSYMLDHFAIPCRKATKWERMEPFERGRRAIAKWASRRKPFASRVYLEQEGSEFDPRLLTMQPRHTQYLDGLWQDERYFSDIEPALREELRFRLSPNTANIKMAVDIRNSQSVGLHVRWFDVPTSSGISGLGKNLATQYYRSAIRRMERNVSGPHYFLFSDDVVAARESLCLSPNSVTVVDINRGAAEAALDMWLMSQCKHFIMANSTFSWWGAWLGRTSQSFILMPRDVPSMRGGLAWDANADQFV